MFNKTTIDKFKELAQHNNQVAVYQEIAGDNLTPVSVFHALGDLNKQATLLESIPASGEQARFSYIGIEPIDELRLKNDKHAIEKLRQFHQKQRCASQHSLNGFVGGAVGFMAYDAVRQFETLPDRHPDEDQIPDFDFMSYQTNLSFDHHSNKVVLSTRISVNDSLETCFNQAMQKLDKLAQHIRSTPLQNNSIHHPEHSKVIEVDISDEDYQELVNQAKSYIEAGDIFQVVLSRRFSKPLNALPFSVYRALRMISPSPYLFYIDRGDYVITGASPEKLISVTDKQVSSFPIAGTRPLSEKPDENKQREEELLHDEKELAEHVMLVDLARNDLGKVCKPGTVQVDNFKQVQRYSHVMHITSEVTGTLNTELDALDALQAAFPAGTLSGAPKIRAMEIIDELEQSRRGAYGGVVCFMDNDNNLNSCITIRTAIIRDNQVTVRAGGGIVYDSDPQTEADETRHKAQSVLKAIELAEGGLA